MMSHQNQVVSRTLKSVHFTIIIHGLSLLSEAQYLIQCQEATPKTLAVDSMSSFPCEFSLTLKVHQREDGTFWGKRVLVTVSAFEGDETRFVGLVPVDVTGSLNQGARKLRIEGIEKEAFVTVQVRSNQTLKVKQQPVKRMSQVIAATNRTSRIRGLDQDSKDMQIKILQEERSVLKIKLELLQKQFQLYRQSHIQSLQNNSAYQLQIKVRNLQQALRAYQKKCQTFQQVCLEKDELEQRCSRLAGEQESLKAKCQEQSQLIAGLEQVRTHLAGQLDEERRRAALSSEATTTSLQQSYRRLNDKVKGFQTETQLKEAELSKLQTRYDHLLEKYEAQTTQLKEVVQLAEGLEARQSELQGEIRLRQAELKEEKSRSKLDRDAKVSAQTQLKTSLSQSQGVSDGLRNRVLCLEAEKKQLVQRIASRYPLPVPNDIASSLQKIIAGIELKRKEAEVSLADLAAYLEQRMDSALNQLGLAEIGESMTASPQSKFQLLIKALKESRKERQGLMRVCRGSERSREQISALQEKVFGLERAIAEKDKQLRDSARKLGQLQMVFEESRCQAERKCDQMLSDFEVEIKQCLSMYNSKQEALLVSQERVRTLQARLVEAKKEMACYSQQIRAGQIRLVEAERELLESRSAVERKRGEVVRLKQASTTNLQLLRAEHQAKESQLQSALDQLQKEYEVKCESLAEQRQRVGGTQTEIAKLHGIVAQYKSQCQQLGERLSQLAVSQGRVEEANRHLRDLQRYLSKACEDMQAENQALAAEVERLMGSVSRKNAEIEGVRNESRSKGLRVAELQQMLKFQMNAEGLRTAFIL